MSLHCRVALYDVMLFEPIIVMFSADPALLNVKILSCMLPPVPRQLRWQYTTKDLYAGFLPNAARSRFIWLEIVWSSKTSCTLTPRRLAASSLSAVIFSENENTAMRIVEPAGTESMV